MLMNIFGYATHLPVYALAAFRFCKAAMQWQVLPDVLRSFFVLVLAAHVAACSEAKEVEILSSAVTPVQTEKPAMRDNATRLNPNSTVGHILNHPALAGFGRLILPWDGRSYEANMRLSEISSLLPYHTNVNSNDVAGALNHMIDAASNGKTVFYDIYSEAQKRQQPSKRNTGLFFFRGKPGAPFAVISPGGGFSYVGSVHEGFPYAAEISKRGHNAFVLKYRVGDGGRVATEDLAAALSYIFQNAQKLEVGTAGYSLWGSSAGARMAAAIGSHGVAAFGGNALPKPSAVVMAYTAHSDLSSNEPPTFVVVGERDGIAPPSSMERRVSALRRMGTEVEFRTYKDIAHGFGPGTGTSAEGWIADATRFWEKFMTKPGQQQQVSDSERVEGTRAQGRSD